MSQKRLARENQAHQEVRVFTEDSISSGAQIALLGILHALLVVDAPLRAALGALVRRGSCRLQQIEEDN